MKTIFDAAAGSNGTVSYAQQWGQAKDIIKRNLQTVTEYYHKHPIAVRSDHFLVRLLQSITVSQNMDTDRYYENVSGMALNLSMALKMTSSIFQGSVHRGVFYTSTDDEILIAIDESFNPMEAEQDWENIQAVKVLRHSISDLGINLPVGKQTGSESGLVVVTVNIPLLAVQYRAFRNNESKTQAEMGTTGDSQRSIMHFVHMYVLTNMLPTHLDCVLLNRFYNLSKGIPLGDSYTKHSFHLVDASKPLNTASENFLAAIRRSPKNFVSILRYLPAFTSVSLDTALVLPKIAHTRQVLWALSVARLPAMDLMMTLTSFDKRNWNRGELNSFVRMVQQFNNNNLIKTVLTGHTYRQVQYELDYLLQQAAA